MSRFRPSDAALFKRNRHPVGTPRTPVSQVTLAPASLALALSNTTPSPNIEPTYNAGTQTLILQDNFDTYVTFADVIAGGWRAMDNTTVQDVTTGAGGSNLVIPDRTTGKAIRLRYYGVSSPGSPGQEAHSWSHTISDTLAAKPGHTCYIQKWFRINTNGVTLDDINYHIVKVKWLELWGITNSGNRAQFNTSYQTQFNMPSICVTGDGAGTFWQVFGNAGGNTAGQATQIRGPYAKNGANAWHRATFKYRTNSAPGARDGCAMMWLDGTLIVAVSSEFMDVVVPGNDTGVTGPPYPYWCAPEDLDNLFTNDGISKITLGSVMTASVLWAFDIDYDDIMIWRD